MSLHKWCGNTELTPKTEKEYEISATNQVKTLGISWRAHIDCFAFKVEVECLVHPIKRSMLSTIARLFDPFGFLGWVLRQLKQNFSCNNYGC
ncbi:reverse transcriptase [Caerostris extrusa]|uniref:Reverse transcriptase n=1 Tax=Caerostris extrusa TaxID=172846 RepID=A0AAV4TV03_CAEEX|nr:reverse transcriptase [Caerostris extrusa]